MKKESPIEIVREYIPEASDEEAEHIIWSHTGYPCFWNIGVDGASPLECFRKQLNEYQKGLI